jgi:SAM-dependent methyltransferase
MSEAGHTLELLQPCLPNDHSRQITAEYYLKLLFGRPERIARVMDLGCGTGGSVDYFRALDSEVQWIGLDIPESPEVSARRRSDAHFYSFDGVNIPFGSGTFDLIYSKQVLEHVRHPSDLLREIHRVLRPGGHFVGSTSCLEPYHSRSLWNYTPYGLRCLIEETELRLIEVRPGIDGVSLILRRLLGAPSFLEFWFAHESPLNMMIGLGGGILRKGHGWTNAAKLVFSGHICFLALKPY